MRPTEDLKAEHEGVLLALDILEKIRLKVKSGGQLPISQIDQLIGFFTVFVDKCHHGKEESLLFPAMIEVDSSLSDGLITVLLAEHEKARGFVRSMKTALEKFKEGSLKASGEFSSNAEAYVELLRQHVEKENKVLFTMADSILSAPKQAEILEGFEIIEEERVGHGIHEQFHKMLHSLRDEYHGQ